MIPTHIWDKQCKYCRFRQKDENKRIDKYNGPCLIGGADDDEPEAYFWIDNKKISTMEYYNTNYCLHWKPNKEYGLCNTCEYFNHFADDTEYCTHLDGPLNRKLVYDVKPDGPADCWKYDYCHCERYSVDPYWKDTMIKQALDGKIPKNFNPETWEPTKINEEYSLEWEFKKSDKEYEERKEKQKKIQEESDRAAEKKTKKNKLDYIPDGQMSIFSFISETE